MIAICICKCPNGPTKAYKFLEPLVENWFDVPMYIGRKKCNDFLDKFQGYPDTLTSPHQLSNHLLKVSKYIVVVGWNREEFTWADIEDSKPQSTIDAELIIEKFA